MKLATSDEEMNKSNRISFFSKNPIICPVCEESFYREEILTGRGRTIAGNLRVDLRRLWEENPKYGKVIPTLYSITVCPHCFSATYQSDFESLSKYPQSCQNLLKATDQRKKAIFDLFEEEISFKKEKNLKSGIASYILSILTYEQLPARTNPTFKSAMSCLRLAWLCEEADEEFMGENYGYLARIFYQKATFLYQRVEELEISGDEPIGDIHYFGPDSDVNYGYDGVLYLSALLQYMFGEKEDKKLRYENLGKSRRTLSRIVGMGKSSKTKPSNIISKAREVYSRISEEYKSLEFEMH